MKRGFGWLAAALAATFLPVAGWAAGSGAKAEARSREAMLALSRYLKDEHVSHRAPDDLISKRAWTNVLEMCDEDHTVFLDTDIAEFQQSETRLDDAFRRGDCSFAFRVRNVYCERLRERTAFATNLLARATFDFTGNDTYLFDRKDQPWLAEGAARDALWTAKLKGEVLDEWLLCETGGVAKAAATVAERYTETLNETVNRSKAAMRDEFIAAVVSAYDAHTLYLPPPHYRMFKAEMNLSFCGVGAEWTFKDGGAKVNRVIPGGPLAEDGHIHAGDVITGVAPKGKGKIISLRGRSQDEVVALFIGEKGSKVTLEVRHPDGQVNRYTIERGDVPMESSAASSSVVEIDVAGERRKVGYLRLPSFYSDTDIGSKDGRRCCSEDLRAELEKLKREEVCGVLFDLRGNNGGSLDDAVKVIGLFVRNGPAVRMKGLGGETTLPVPDGGIACEVPVLVLTSLGNASAGELVPATLQDLGRAVIAGDVHTFGKGSAQTVCELGADGKSALVVTDGRFYRVTGASTQFEGVVSDIPLPSLCEDDAYAGERGLSYPLPWDKIEGIAFNPSWDLGTFIPELRTASAARLAANPAWKKHLEMLESAKARAMSKTKSLNYEARKAELKRDEAVDKAWEKFTEEGFDPAKKGTDIVLDEALCILSDLVRLNAGRTLPEAKPIATDAGGLFNTLDDD